MRILKFKKVNIFLVGLMMMAFLLCWGSQAKADQKGDYYYNIIDGEAQITGYTGAGGAITIPSTLGGVAVTSIGNNAFYCISSFSSATRLTSIIISPGVKSIGERAFCNCTGLKTISIPKGTISIGYQAFYNCTGLKSINIPQEVTSIGEEAFEGCTSLTSITFNSATTTIYNNFGTIPYTTKIIGYDPSTAKDYAIFYGNVFEVISNPSPSNSEKYSILEHFNNDNDPNVFNIDLAKRAAIYSMLAYEDYKYNGDNIIPEDIYNNIYNIIGNKSCPFPIFLAKKLEQDNFKNIQAKNYQDYSEDKVAFVIANKDVYYKGNKRNLTTVIIRGTEGNEWKGDMDITGSQYDSSQTIHTGFNTASEDVLEQLKAYLNNHSIKDPLLFITGHSRGAAVANLLADDLNSKSDPQFVNSEVFAYTFATPNVTINNNTTSSNIFNFCFIDDFVPQVPLNGWGYSKPGITFTVVAQDLYRQSNSPFRSDLQAYDKTLPTLLLPHSPEFNYKKTKTLIDHFKGIWPYTPLYYNRTLFPDKNGVFGEDISLYNFMRNYVAPAAAANGLFQQAVDAVPMIKKGRNNPTYGPITDFFVNGSISDTHQMYTYYSALKNGGFDTSISALTIGHNENIVTNNSFMANKLSASTPHIFSVNTTTSTSNPTNYDSSEVQKLKNFAQQGDNLQNLGWNLDDVSTWDGVLWSDDAESNIVSINIRYKGLTGTLDVSGFSKLENIDFSGNSITSVDLSGCTSLTDVDCSHNQLTQLSLSNSQTLNNLDCSWNEIAALNIDGCASLAKLYCNNNQLTSLDLTTDSQLTDLYCAANDLITLDILSNPLLNSLSCEQNYFDIQSGSVMLSAIQTVEARDNSWVSYQPQKMPENPVFNAADAARLLAFANQGDNVTKLQWDLSKPQEWYGVEWVKVGNEYRANRIAIDNLELTGNLDLSDMPCLESLSCSNNQLTSINVSNCATLEYLASNTSSIKTLDIANCPALTNLDCDNNYLDFSGSSELMNNINGITQKEGSIVKYDVQKIFADKNIFNQNEYSKLVDFASISGNQAILNWDINKPGEWSGIVWELDEGQYRVKEISFGYKEVTGSLDLSSFDKLTKLDCGMTKISSIVLPSGITAIESSMFYDCSELTDISIPNGVTSIGEDAFYNCQALTAISLSQGITSIGDGAFASCSGLTSISIPENVTSIGDFAFCNCTGLTSITFNSATTTIYDDAETIPDTTKIIGYDPSTAKDYAKKYNRTFEVIGATNTLQSIAITTPATKLSYNVGNSLDITGLVVTGTYSDGSKKVESITTANVSGFNSTVAVADQVLTITVGTKTTTYKVQIATLVNIDTSGMTQMTTASPTVVPSKVWTINLNGLVDEASIPNNIYVTNSKGIEQATTCTVTTVNGLSQIKVNPSTNYTPDNYILWVRGIESAKGTKIKSQVYLKFTVQ